MSEADNGVRFGIARLFLFTMSKQIKTIRRSESGSELLVHASFRGNYGLITAAMLLLNTAAYGQSDPWTASANNLKTAFTGPIATALIAVAVVVTGMVFAFSEGQGKRQLAGLTFGGAMALGAVRFMAWLFT